MNDYPHWQEFGRHFTRPWFDETWCDGRMFHRVDHLYFAAWCGAAV